MRLDDWLTSVFGVKTFLAALVASVVCVALFQTWASMERAGVTPLDVSFGRQAEEVHDAVAQYRARAQTVYPRFFFVDLVFPVAYSLALSLVMAYVFRRALPRESAARELSLLPFVAALADYAENFSVLALYLKSPARPAFLARSVVLANACKLLLFELSVLLLVGGLLVLLAGRVRRRRAGASGGG